MPELQLHPIAGAFDAPSLNVVFVHGLDGDPLTTWGDPKTAFHWPKALAGAMAGVAVYSLGYPSEKARWNEGWPLAQAATAALDRLLSDQRLRQAPQAPIAFVCHSLGGLIVKKMILTARDGAGQQPAMGRFNDRIRGVVFLATPHQGSTLATIANSFYWFVSDSLRAIAAEDVLLNLAGAYRDLVADGGGRIRHRAFFETKSIAGAKPVEPASADPGIAGTRPIRTACDHFGICKPTHAGDQVYASVLAFLQDEVLTPRPPTDGEKLDEMLALMRQSDVVSRAAAAGITEAAVRAVVERLTQDRLDARDLIPWLHDWVAAAQVELARRTNEDEAFENARQEAWRRFRQGRDRASEALMDEFRREERAEFGRQQERKRRRLRLLEEAVRIDERALDSEAAAAKLRLMALVDVGEDADAIGAWLFARADEFYRRGDEAGDNAALMVAIAAWRAALREYTRERVPLAASKEGR